MRRKEEKEEAVHLPIYRQPYGRGAGRQQLFADVKCQERDNEVKPLSGDLDIPRCAALLATRLQRELNHTKCTAAQRTIIQSYRDVTPQNRVLGSAGNSAHFIETQDLLTS
jgi:hypothetical protein